MEANLDPTMRKEAEDGTTNVSVDRQESHEDVGLKEAQPLRFKKKATAQREVKERRKKPPIKASEPLEEGENERETAIAFDIQPGI
jgi:hypothetical protein